MTLSDWLDNRWLVGHRASPEEIAAEEIFQLARDLRSRVLEWLERNHPHRLTTT